MRNLLLLALCCVFCSDQSHATTNTKRILELENHASYPNAQYNDDLLEGDIKTIGGRQRQNYRNIISYEGYKWRNNTVPYVLGSSLNVQARLAINDAINDFHKYSCVRWVPRSDESDYVEFLAGQGCYSYVAVIGGSQPISLGQGCETRGIAIHEMLHTVGFYHEQSRSDRDDYVDILWQNVKPGLEGNFRKLAKYEEETYGTAYDYSSVMHYMPTAFSKNGLDTVRPKQNGIEIVGQRMGFSDVDLFKLNHLYGCLTYLPGSTRRPTPSTTVPETTTRPTTPWSCKDEYPFFYCNLYQTSGLCRRPEFHNVCQETCCVCDIYKPPGSDETFICKTLSTAHTTTTATESVPLSTRSASVLSTTPTPSSLQQTRSTALLTTVSRSTTTSTTIKVNPPAICIDAWLMCEWMKGYCELPLYPHIKENCKRTCGAC